MHPRNPAYPRLAALLALTLLAAAPPTVASDRDELSAIRTDLETLRKNQEQTQADVAAIRKLLEGARAPREPEFQATAVDLGTAPIRGSADASLVVLEFSDFQCPFCRRHAQGVLPELVKNYVDTGKVRYAMKQFPLASLHPQAELAAQAALCAQDQGKYWEFHDALFSWSGEITAPALEKRAGELGMKKDAFATCVKDGRKAKAMAEDQALGQKLGVQGTPNFFLGRIDPTHPGQVTLVQRIPGAVGYPVFSAAIDALLKPADAAPEKADAGK
jgi:protein-disulfide isomerase